MSTKSHISSHFHALSSCQKFGQTKRFCIETLESRHLLSAAVGAFSRDDGHLWADSGARAEVLGEVSVNGYVSDRAIIQSDDGGERAATVRTEDGFAHSVQATKAIAPGLIGSSIVAPFVTVTGIVKTLIFNEAMAKSDYAAGVGVDGSEAEGEYSYVVDPLHASNLYFHGHVFVATTHGGLASGGAEITANYTSVEASAPFASVSGGVLRVWKAGGTIVPIPVFGCLLRRSGRGSRVDIGT
jgi:hypothetical protein